MTRHMVRHGGREEMVSSIPELELWLDRLRQESSGELWLVQHKGSMKGLERILYRLLGLATESTGDAVHILTSQGKAVIVFLDKDYNEYRFSSENNVQDPKTQFQTDDGQIEEVPTSECVATDQALDAARHFFQTGKKPDWFHYRVVK